MQYVRSGVGLNRVAVVGSGTMTQTHGDKDVTPRKPKKFKVHGGKPSEKGWSQSIVKEIRKRTNIKI
jgi:hypothetical protein